MADRCLTVAQLELAAGGELSTRLRQHLNTCLLCQSAVDGYELNEELASLTATELTAQASARRPAASGSGDETGRLRWIRYAAAAASLALLVWAGWRYTTQADTEPELMEEFAYIEQPYPRITRSDEASDDYYLQAATAFEKGDLTLSTKLYRDLIAQASSELQLTRGHYEYGLALWRNGDHSSAIEELTAARFGEASYYEDATWALAQLYRSMGSIPISRQLLIDLSKQATSPYAARAQRLMELMDREQIDALNH